MGFSATACLGPRALMLKATYFIRFPVGSDPFIIDDAGRLFWKKKKKKKAAQISWHKAPGLSLIV